MASPFLLTAAALLLIAYDVSRQERKPLIVVAGLVLLGLGVTGRIFTASGLIPVFTGILADMGVGLLLGAVLLKVRRGPARPFFNIGVLALSIAALFLLGGHLFANEAPNAAAELSGEALVEGVFDDAFLLELGPDDQIEEVAALIEAYDGTYAHAFPGLTLDMDADLAQVYLVEAPLAQRDRLMEALRADGENVDFVAQNRVVTLEEPLEEEAVDAHIGEEVLEDDPMVGQQWGLNAIHAHPAHKLLRDATPVRKGRVAIVDTGVDSAHEDIREVFGKSPGITDHNGHGSHCAGIAGAPTNNGIGIASLNWEGAYVEITGYAALSAQGAGTEETIAQAIIDAARDGADVISLSLGYRILLPPRLLTQAVQFAQRQGAIVVASAGNSNANAADHAPSNIEGVISVAAVDQKLKKASFSNTVGTLKRPIAAPGVKILSLKPKQGYVHLSGTSMSTPMVTGLLGVMRALNPDLSAEDAYRILHDTGQTLPDTPRVGRLINAEAAIATVLAPAS